MIMEDAPRKILVVDDEDTNRKLLKILLESLNYVVDTASNGQEALDKVSAELPDLILLDIMMPGMDGYEVCKRLKESPDTSFVPIIILSALADMESRVKGLSMGANDFLSKPFDRSELAVRVGNLLKAKEYDDFIIEYNRMLEAEVNKKTSDLQTAFEELRAANEELVGTNSLLKEGYLDTIEKLTSVAEYKDHETANHVIRVREYSGLFAIELGFSDEESETIKYGSTLHDIGKIAIPSEILLKTGGLTSEEFVLMKTHTTVGAAILENPVSDYLKKARVIALTHHERWDGSGYPAGLRGEDIPIEGRIVNIVDQYDALRSVRPYKRAFDHDTVLKILTEGDGRSMPGHLDPRVLEVFLDIHGKIAEVYDEFKDAGG